MPTCVLRYCKSRSGRCPESNWSFFSFPTVSSKTRKEWIRFVQKERREESWRPSSASKLCSKHFRNKDIKVGKTGRACLKKGSLPFEDYDKKPTATSESDDGDIKSVSDDETEADDVLDLKPVTDDMSDSKAMFDDAAEISWKAQVNIMQKQRILQQAKIKKLEEQNQLLKRKLSKLKNFVIHLVKKNDLQITGQMHVTPRK